MGATGDGGHFDALARAPADDFTVGLRMTGRWNGCSPVPARRRTTSPEEQADDAAGLLQVWGPVPVRFSHQRWRELRSASSWSAIPGTGARRNPARPGVARLARRLRRGPSPGCGRWSRRRSRAVGRRLRWSVSGYVAAKRAGIGSLRVFGTPARHCQHFVWGRARRSRARPRTTCWPWRAGAHEARAPAGSSRPRPRRCSTRSAPPRRTAHRPAIASSTSARHRVLEPRRSYRPERTTLVRAGSRRAPLRDVGPASTARRRRRCWCRRPRRDRSRAHPTAPPRRRPAPPARSSASRPGRDCARCRAGRSVTTVNSSARRSASASKWPPSPVAPMISRTGGPVPRTS